LTYVAAHSFLVKAIFVIYMPCIFSKQNIDYSSTYIN
jgi:hypothetical protein